MHDLFGKDLLVEHGPELRKGGQGTGRLQGKKAGAQEEPGRIDLAGSAPDKPQARANWSQGRAAILSARGRRGASESEGMDI